MERKVNYVLVGFFSLALLAGFVGFVFWANARGTGKPVTAYAIYFDQAVNGLSLGSTVRYLGVEAGHVEAIDLDTSQTPPRVRVVAGLDKGIPMTHGTMATLKPSGITGVSFIDLHSDPADTAPIAEQSEGMPVIRSESSGFDRLFEGATGSLGRLDRLLSNENLILINKTFTSLDRISARIDAMLNAHEASLNRLLGPDVDELGQTIRSARRMLDSITALTRSLGDNPSQILFPPDSKGVKVAP